MAILTADCLIASRDKLSLSNATCFFFSSVFVFDSVVHPYTHWPSTPLPSEEMAK